VRAPGDTHHAGRVLSIGLTWNGNGWNLTVKEGILHVFGDVAPLQAIRDRYGDTVTITHANGQTGNVTRVTSPSPADERIR